MLKVGDKIDTNFTLKVVKDGEEQDVKFSDLLSRPTIISVYMKNNTPGCNLQNRSLVDYAEKINKMGYNIVALSKDSCNSHKKYAEKFGINYVLASDPENRFSKAVDSIVSKKMFGLSYEGPTRSAYVLDKEGKILGIIGKVHTRDHGGEVIELLKNLDN